MAQGWLQLAVFVAIVVALTRPLGAYMAGVFRNERVFLTPGHRPGRAAHLPDPPRRSERGPELEGLCAQPDRLLALLLAGAVSDPAHPGHPAVQPGGVRLGAVGRELQHRLVVRHQHQLAVLRRRDDAQLLRPDGGADGAELRHARGRDLRAVGADPRHHRAAAARDSATSGRTWCEASTTSSCRCRSSSP